jgi:hypothetical protein
VPVIALRLRDPHNVVRNMTNPEWWNRYKEYVLRTVEIELPSFLSRFVASGNFFTSRTGNAVRSFRAKSERNSVIIWSTAEYLKYLNYGVRRQQMTWLLSAEVRDYLAFDQYPYRARAPIPIQTEAGNLIFRRATPLGMSQGKWIHPGLPEQKFFEQGIEAYLNEFRQRHADLVLELMD